MRTRPPRPLRRGVRPDRRPRAGHRRHQLPRGGEPAAARPAHLPDEGRSSQWWFAVLVGDHGNPLRAVEVRQGGAWRAATRQDYNYWLIDSGAGPGPYTVRVTDAYGHRVTASGIRMLPGQTQRSTVRMYGTADTTRPTTPTRTPSARPSPRPTTTAGPTTAPAAGPTMLDAAVAAPTPDPVRARCG